MQNWEYYSITVVGDEIWENLDRSNKKTIETTEVINFINQKGAEGWELVAATSNGAFNYYYFKRPKG